MQRYILAVGLALFVTPAFAQQQMPSLLSPSQMALRINEAIGQLAQQAEMDKVRADNLQQRIADLQKQLDELKANKQTKIEPPK